MKCVDDCSVQPVLWHIRNKNGLAMLAVFDADSTLTESRRVALLWNGRTW